jgi:predicted transcriptional regulator
MRQHAEAEQIKSGHESRRIARDLRQQGFSVSDIAAVLDVSRGRVSQLVTAKHEAEAGQ